MQLVHVYQKTVIADVFLSSPPQACVARGEDFDRVKLLDVSAADAEKYERMKKIKKNPDQGFSGMLCLFSLKFCCDLFITCLYKVLI